MKRKFLIFGCSLVAIAAVATTVWSSKQKFETVSGLLKNDLEALTQSEGGGSGCSWRQLDCPGWGSGDFEACLNNGDGNSCGCGGTTRDC